MYNILPSSPPNSQLDTNSGILICPINSRFLSKHLIAFPALVQMLPSLSHLKPSEKKGLKSYTSFLLFIQCQQRTIFFDHWIMLSRLV